MHAAKFLGLLLLSAAASVSKWAASGKASLSDRRRDSEGRVLRNIASIVYLLVGVVVAVLLWPLVLFGVSLHIK